MYAFLLQARINARLQQYRAKAELARSTRPQAWVPREKLPRPLTSSASAIRKLMRKAELMGISTDIFPVDNSDTSSSVDGRRKHKQPALTADFVNYYFGQYRPWCMHVFIENSLPIEIFDTLSMFRNLLVLLHISNMFIFLISCGLLQNANFMYLWVGLKVSRFIHVIISMASFLLCVSCISAFIFF